MDYVNDKIVPFELPMDSTTLGDLYRIEFELEPQSRLFNDVAPYRLYLWLFAQSDKSASSKAYAIVQQLPYTVAPDGTNLCCRVLLASTVSEDSNPDLAALNREHEQIARRCGLSFIVICGPRSEPKPGAA